MNATQIIEIVKLIIGNRKMAGNVVISREPGTSSHDLYVTLYNEDGIGKRETLLASLESVKVAVEVRNRLNLGI
jgi:hypothetical protein